MRKLFKGVLILLSISFVIAAVVISCYLGFQFEDPVISACAMGLAMALFGAGGAVLIGSLWLIYALMGD